MPGDSRIAIAWLAASPLSSKSVDDRTKMLAPPTLRGYGVYQMGEV
jgi:hypothetical protein